jgi:streptogramin lyase
MKTPTGIAVDNREKIYICDLDSNNVQRYSPSGHFCDVLLKGSEITEPRAICFNKVSKYFALSNNGGKSICVYKSIFTDRLDSKELSPNLTPNLYFADCENKV